MTDKEPNRWYADESPLLKQSCNTTTLGEPWKHQPISPRKLGTVEKDIKAAESNVAYLQVFDNHFLEKQVNKTSSLLDVIIPEELTNDRILASL